MAFRSRFFRFVPSALLIVLVCMAFSPGDARSKEVISDFASTVRIEADGTLLVEEAISFVAEGNSINYGLFRDFPLTYKGPANYQGEVPFSVVSVHLDGKKLSDVEVDRTRDNARVLMRSPSRLAHGEHTLVLAYRTAGHVRSYEAYDELNWNVTGDGWAFTIEQASCEVILPEDCAVDQTAAWVGKKGTRETPVEIDADGNRVVFTALQSVQPGEHFTAALSFPLGFVRDAFLEKNATPAQPAPSGGQVHEDDTPRMGDSPQALSQGRKAKLAARGIYTAKPGSGTASEDVTPSSVEDPADEPDSGADAAGTSGSSSAAPEDDYSSSYSFMDTLEYYFDIFLWRVEYILSAPLRMLQAIFSGYAWEYKGMILVLLSFAFYGISWLVWGKDPPKGTIIPLFHAPLAGWYGKGAPPPDIRENTVPISAAATGYLQAEGRMGSRLFATIFLQLALRGVCAITRTGKREFAVKALDPGQKGIDALSPEERAVYTILREEAGDEELPFTSDNGATLRAMSKAAGEAIKERYGTIWSHNEGVQTLGWFLVTPLCLVLYFLEDYSFSSLFVVGSLTVTVLTVIRAKVALLIHLIKVSPSFVIALLLGLLLFGLVGGTLGVGLSIVLLLGFASIDQGILGLTPVTLAAMPFVFNRIMKAPSKKGRKLLDSIEGLAMFISVAEKDRLRFENPPDDSPEVFQEMLPYAVSMGLEKTWCSRFASQLAQGLITNEHLSDDAWSEQGIRGFVDDFSRNTATASTPPSSGSSFSDSAFSSSGGGSGSGSGGGGGGGL